MSDSQPRTSNPSPVDTTAPAVPKLQREAVVMVNERGRLGLLVALCSLAGVAVGFALSNMAMGLHAHYCNSRLEAPLARIVVPAAAAETPTWLGVRITSHPGGGAHIEAIEPSSPASAAGLQRGDVIVGFADNGCPRQVRTVRSARDLVHLVRSAAAGDQSLIRVERDNELRTLHATLSHMPEQIFFDELGGR